MKNSSKKTAIFTGIIGVIIILHSPAFAKTDTAPGQERKEENSQNAKHTTSPTVVTKKDAMKKAVQDSVSHKKTKIGTEKLKDLISKLSSGSSELDSKSVGKIAKVKVAIASQSAQLRRHAVSGIITGLADGIITIVHQIHRERTYQILTNDQTVITLKGVTTTAFADLAFGQRVAVVGEPTEGGLLAKRIHVIPGKAVGVFGKQPLATPSGTLLTTPSPTSSIAATPSPTAEATETPTPTPTP